MNVESKKEEEEEEETNKTKTGEWKRPAELRVVSYYNVFQNTEQTVSINFPLRENVKHHVSSDTLKI